jgi:hypothetical protein
MLHYHPVLLEYSVPARSYTPSLTAYIFTLLNKSDASAGTFFFFFPFKLAPTYHGRDMVDSFPSYPLIHIPTHSGKKIKQVDNASQC